MDSLNVYEFTVNDKVYITEARSLVTALLQLSDMVKGTISSISCKLI